MLTEFVLAPLLKEMQSLIFYWSILCIIIKNIVFLLPQLVNFCHPNPSRVISFLFSDQNPNIILDVIKNTPFYFFGKCIKNMNEISYSYSAKLSLELLLDKRKKSNGKENPHDFPFPSNSQPIFS